MLRSLFFLLCLLWSGAVFAESEDDFARLPIQDGGRIKPMQTFADVILERFSGAKSLAGMSSIEWLKQVLFDPESAMQQPLFLVKDADTRIMLNLADSADHRYRFADAMEALGEHAALMQSLLDAPPASLNPSQNAALELYDHVTTFAQLARSLTLILPLSMEMEVLQLKALAVKSVPQNFLQAFLLLPAMQQHPTIFAQAIERINLIDESSRDSTLLRVIPPPWERNNSWISPWTLFHSSQGSPQTGALMRRWQALAYAYQTKNGQSFQRITQELLAVMLQAPDIRPAALTVEILYDQTHIITVTMALYIAGLVLTLLCLAGVPYMHGVALAMTGTGSLAHALTIAARIFILERPPVGTLYESLLFVGLVGVWFGLLLEWRLRNVTGLLAASLTGALLLIASESLRAGEDSLSMLVAVLNTNFWLATHVLCITTGYGFGIIAALTAHFYLILRCRRTAPERLAAVYRTAYASALITLLFTSLGTILGGIWADQSWGRFWGWDPKENGALLICLWLIWLLHGRITARFSEKSFALLLVLLNVIIALSWLGVNLLNTGLHSYGFTDKAALSLAMFCMVEVGFAVGVALYRRHDSLCLPAQGG